MAKLTPQEMAARWKANTQASTQAYRAGIERVTESPTEKAAQKKDKMLQNLTASITSGKWERGLRAVSLTEWRQKTISKGAPRIAAGVEAAEPKFIKFATQLNAHQDAIKAELETMPDLTLQDNIQRMVHNVQRMSEFEFDKTK